MGGAAKHDPETTRRMYDEVMRLMADDARKPPIRQVLPLAQAPQAMQRLLERNWQGLRTHGA